MKHVPAAKAEKQTRQPQRRANAAPGARPMRKITVDVDARTLEAARAEGAGVAETIREALKELAHRRASQKLLALEGKVDLGMTWQEMRGKDDD